MATKPYELGNPAKKQPAVIQSLKSGATEPFSAKEVNQLQASEAQKKGEWRLAVWCEDMTLARKRAQDLNARACIGPRKQPELPKKDEPGSPVKQMVDWKPEKPGSPKKAKEVKANLKASDEHEGLMSGPAGIAAVVELYDTLSDAVEGGLLKSDEEMHQRAVDALLQAKPEVEEMEAMLDRAERDGMEDSADAELADIGRDAEEDVAVEKNKKVRESEDLGAGLKPRFAGALIKKPMGVAAAPKKGASSSSASSKSAPASSSSASAPASSSSAEGSPVVHEHQVEGGEDIYCSLEGCGKDLTDGDTYFTLSEEPGVFSYPDYCCKEHLEEAIANGSEERLRRMDEEDPQAMVESGQRKKPVKHPYPRFKVEAAAASSSSASSSSASSSSASKPKTVQGKRRAAAMKAELGPGGWGPKADPGAVSKAQNEMQAIVRKIKAKVARYGLQESMGQNEVRKFHDACMAGKFGKMEYTQAAKLEEELRNLVEAIEM